MSRKSPDKHAAPAEPDSAAADIRRRRSEKSPAEEDWADRAAQARTADDERAVAPHDRTGVPSTGDRI